MDKTAVQLYQTMAKFDLDEANLDWVTQTMSALEEKFKKIEEIDTQGVEPLYTVLDLKNILREDVSAKVISRDELLANAPEEYDGYFQVPKTLE